MSTVMAYNNPSDRLGSLSQAGSMNLETFGEESVTGGFGPDFASLADDSTLQELLLTMQQPDSKFDSLEGSPWPPPSEIDMWGAAVPETHSGASMTSMHSDFTSDRQMSSAGRLNDMLIDSPEGRGEGSIFGSRWQSVPPVPKWSIDPIQNLGTAPLLSSGLRVDGSNNPFLNVLNQELKPSVIGMGRTQSASELSSLMSFPRFPDAGLPDLEPRPDVLDPSLNSIISNLGSLPQGGAPARRMSDSQLFIRSQALINQQTQLQNNLLKSIEEHMSQRLPPKKPASHSAAERRRRDRINERFNMLRELIPGSSKSDKASVLGEVIEYVKRLQVQSRLWEDKHVTSSTVTPDAMSHEQEVREVSLSLKCNADMSATTSGQMRTREGEASSIGDDISIEADGTSLIIKICCADRKGLLAKITATLRDLSLDVQKAEILTSNSRAVDTFRVVPEGDLLQSTDIIKRQLLAVAFPGGAPIHLAIVKQEMFFPTQDLKVERDVKVEKDEKRRRISSEK